MRYAIGVDLGTSGVKVLLASEDGNICADATANYSPDLPHNGWSEQDPEVWWSATVDAIAKLIESYPLARGNITALACSGQMHSSVFLDDRGNVIRKAILWNDTRTTPQVAEIYKTISKEELLENVYNLALEGFTLPKLLWLRNNEPENYKKIDKMIMPKDYINFRLTGVCATDQSDGAGTLLYDVANHCWSEKLINALGIDKNILPPVLNSTDVVGTAIGEITELLGTNCQVVAGGADNSCAAVGSGMSHEGQGIISIGTSGTVIACLNSLTKKADGSVHLFNYSVPNTLYAMGCMLSAGECLNHLKRTFFENISFRDMDKLAEKSPVGSKGLIYLPYIFGERTPHNDPNARGVFFGISGASSQGDFIRSLLEGVAFGIREMYENVAKFTNIQEFTLTGGGAKSYLWSQIIADVMNKPLKINSVSEGPSLGAVFLAMTGNGMCGNLDEIQSAVLKCDKIVYPSPDSNKYEPYYKIYKELYRTNKAIFAKLKNIAQ